MRRLNAFALMVTMALSVKTQFAVKDVIRNMVNAFIQKNAGVNLDGTESIVQNAFHIGIVSMATVINPMNANVSTDILEKIVIQQLNIRMVIGEVGEPGQLVQ